MSKLFQLLTVIYIVKYTAGNFAGVERHPEKIGGVLEEDFAVTFSLQTQYQDLGTVIDIQTSLSDKYDYHVSIEQNNLHQCSGAVAYVGVNKIDKVVIAPANCVLGKTELKIRYGTAKRELEGTEVDVKYVKIHPKYKDDSHNNDIALLYPKDDITVKNVLLPAAQSKSFIGSEATVTGWPTIYQPNFKNLLLYAKVPIVDATDCWPIFDQCHLCAGYKTDTDSYCYLNTGSPLVIDNTLVGFTMYDRGCRRRITPSIYLDVSKSMSDFNLE